MSEKIITLKAHLLQTVKDFMASNHLASDNWAYWRGDRKRPIVDDITPGIRFTADVNKPSDPDGIRVELTDHNRVIIPAGRMVSFRYEAGIIEAASSTLPLDPVPFATAMRIAREIGDQFEQAGYQRKRRVDDLTEKDIRKELTQFRHYGKWKLPGTELAEYSLSIEAYSSLSGAAFTTPLTDARPSDAPETYLLRFYAGVDYEITKELLQLSYARRVAVTGNWKENIPVKLWFDDPGWRPEGWQGKYIR